MDSVDSIGKLVEIEQQAASILQQAEQKASAILLNARNRSESLQRTALAEVRARLERDLAEFRRLLHEQAEKEIEDYRNSLNSMLQDRASLAVTLERLLKEEA